MELQQVGPAEQRMPDRGSDDTARISAVNVGRLRARQRSEIVIMRVPLLHFSLVSLGTIFLMLSIGFAALGREIAPEGTLPPGVRIAGANVGGMEIDQAREHLSARLSGYDERPLTIKHDEKIWTPTLADLGGQFNLEQTLDGAQISQSHAERVRIRMFGPDETVIPLRLDLDQSVLASYVVEVASEIDREPLVPRLAMHDGQLVLSPAETGQEVDQEALAGQIREQLFSLDRSEIEVPVDELQPEFTDADVQAVRGVIREALDSPIYIQFEDRSWALGPDKIAEYLTLRADETGEMRIGFHEDELFAYLDQLIGDVNRPARNARIAWGGSGVVATSASQDGIERNLAAIYPLLEEAIATGNREIQLPVNRLKPAIDSSNLGSLGITSLLSQGESAFWNSSPSRAHNIAVAASYLDGAVVPPGAEFSFNQAIGEISVERGYQEGYVILAEQTAPGIGGGVCQVSTTMFRAAFFSGLPITERHPHAYIVGFYEDGGWPLGFDAAIYQPHADFRFSNTTDSYLLIHTHVADQKLYINIYGPDLGYDVTLGEPVIQNKTDPPADVEVLDTSMAPGARQQVEWSKPGMEVTLPRTVTNRNGDVVRQDYFYSNFQPWGNRFLVGPSSNPTVQTVETAPVPDPPSGEIIEETTEETTEETSND